LDPCPESSGHLKVLAGTELRREEDGALLRSLSGPVYRRQTAAATAFAGRHAPLLASQAGIAPAAHDRIAAKLAQHGGCIAGAGSRESMRP
jgi:hypothetical protein